MIILESKSRHVDLLRRKIFQSCAGWLFFVLQCAEYELHDAATSIDTSPN